MGLGPFGEEEAGLLRRTGPVRGPPSARQGSSAAHLVLRDKERQFQAGAKRATQVVSGEGLGWRGGPRTAEMAGTRRIWPAIGVGGDWSSGTPWLLLSNGDDREIRGG